MKEARRDVMLCSGSTKERVSSMVSVFILLLAMILSLIS